MFQTSLKGVRVSLDLDDITVSPVKPSEATANCGSRSEALGQPVGEGVVFRSVGFRDSKDSIGSTEASGEDVALSGRKASKEAGGVEGDFARQWKEAANPRPKSIANPLVATVAAAGTNGSDFARQWEKAARQASTAVADSSVDISNARGGQNFAPLRGEPVLSFPEDVVNATSRSSTDGVATGSEGNTFAQQWEEAGKRASAAVAERTCDTISVDAATRDEPSVFGGAPGEDDRGKGRVVKTAAAKAKWRKLEKAADKEAAARRADERLVAASDVVFDAVARAGGGMQGEERHLNCEADGTVAITQEALRAALTRYRVPDVACRPDEVEALLAWAAERLGSDPGPLSRNSFGALFCKLGLKVTAEGRVW